LAEPFSSSLFVKGFLGNLLCKDSYLHKLEDNSDEKLCEKFYKSVTRLARSKISEKTISLFGLYRLVFLDNIENNWVYFL